MERNVWSTSQLSTFIELYQQETLLYNVKDELYHNKSARREALQRVVQEMGKIRPGITEAEVKAKWNSLRTQFAKEMQAIRAIPSGSGTTEKPKLWCFEKMLFLQDFIKGRKGISNVPDTASQETVTYELREELDGPGIEGGSEDETGVFLEISQEHVTPSTSTPRVSNVGMPTEPSTTQKRKRRRDEKTAEPNVANAVLETIQESIQSLNRAETNLPETGVFGSFLASELGLFRNSALQKRCKRELLRVLMHFQELDDNE